MSRRRACPRPANDGGGPALRFSGVVHRYRSIVALDHLDLEVARGETLALLGPNGAGKSTAISIVLGLQRAQEGEVSVLGTDPRSAMASGKVGAMLQVGGGSGLPHGVQGGRPGGDDVAAVPPPGAGGAAPWPGPGSPVSPTARRSGSRAGRRSGCASPWPSPAIPSSSSSTSPPSPWTWRVGGASGP